MTRHRPPMVPLAIAVLLIAGCSSLLAPLPDRTRYYVLSAAPKAADVSGSAVEVDFTVGLGPLEIPDYLNRSERAVRLGPNRMRFHDNERWAEALDASTLRVLLQDLAARLGNARVIALPTLVSARRTYDVPLQILRFESTANGDAGLEARWGIKDSATDEILFSGETHLVEPAGGTDTEAAVAALSRVLDRFSEQIATALTRVRATHPPPPAKGRS